MIISNCLHHVQPAFFSRFRHLGPTDCHWTWAQHDQPRPPVCATGLRKPTGRLLPTKMLKNGGFQWCKHEKLCENGDFSDLNIQQCGFHWISPMNGGFDQQKWGTIVANQPWWALNGIHTTNHFMKHEIAKHGEHDDSLGCWVPFDSTPKAECLCFQFQGVFGLPRFDVFFYSVN